jgi:hypothetical protein
MTSTPKRMRPFLALAIVGVCGAAGPAWAQDGVPTWRRGASPGITTPTTPARPGLAERLAAIADTANRAPVAPAPAPTFDGVLTNDNLGSFLSGLGYDPEIRETPAGGRFAVLTIRRGTWTFVVKIVFSKDQGGIWLVSPLTGSLPERGSLPADALANLLALNDEIGPSHFALESGSNALTLNLQFPNRDLTPSRFRERLEEFLTAIQHTESSWSVLSGGGAPSAPGSL